MTDAAQVVDATDVDGSLVRRNTLEATNDATERRCPISNLIRDAGVDLQTRRIRVGVTTSVAM